MCIFPIKQFVLRNIFDAYAISITSLHIFPLSFQCTLPVIISANLSLATEYFILFFCYYTVRVRNSSVLEILSFHQPHFTIPQRSNMYLLLVFQISVTWIVTYYEDIRVTFFTYSLLLCCKCRRNVYKSNFFIHQRLTSATTFSSSISYISFHSLKL